MNCLITEQGKVIECNGGAEHEVICKRELGISLNGFLLKQSGIRIRAGRNDKEMLAIEYYKIPSDKQVRIIHRILRANDYYTVILVLEVIRKFRPIRSFADLN